MQSMTDETVAGRRPTTIAEEREIVRRAVRVPAAEWTGPVYVDPDGAPGTWFESQAAVQAQFATGLGPYYFPAVDTGPGQYRPDLTRIVVVDPAGVDHFVAHGTWWRP